MCSLLSWEQCFPLKVLFLASVLSLWGFAKFDLAFLLPVGVTLSGAVLFLFLLLLCVNLYYEKRG